MALKLAPDGNPLLGLIGICIEDATNRRLVEGVAAQLGLDSVFLHPADVLLPDRTCQFEMLVADEPVALTFRRATQDADRFADKPSEGIIPALVAVILVSTTPENPTIPILDGDQPFDGFLALPLPPAIILAHLGVILYAHRAHVHRYESAMEELHLNRRIFRSVTSGISIANALEPNLPLTYINPAFELMTGYSLEESLGQNCRFLQRGESDQPGLALIREALKARRETVAVLRNFRKNGEPFWNELSLSPIRDRSGQVTHFVGIQNDVTARVAFEAALRESEKLATAGRLAASIAHEINNPLEAVTNLIYLSRHETDDVLREHYLTQADEELSRVSLLTTQSLRFYKQSTKSQAVRPADLISSVLDVSNTRLANSGIVVERRERMSESIVCLESEIRQVISNLVRNAIDAMKGSGGRLLVRTREATGWRSGVRGIVITVADTGIGMSPETREKIYTAFYTTKGIGGTGLGLWVSSEIVERHHGRLLVRSRHTPTGHGTVFALFLPYQGIFP